MRIVSLLASGTELVAALGAGAQLVGRSHECDHPPWVTALPPLSHPTFDVTGASADIDARVRAKLRAGEPLYRIDEPALAALRPDVVITQTHCEVCAVGPSALGDACTRPLLRERVVAFTGGTLDGVLADFLAVAGVIGRPREGARLVAELRAQRERWRAATAALPRPGVVCLEWTDPPFAMGNWGPELVQLAGGNDLLGRAGHSTAVSWDDVRAADPEVLVVAPCGFGLGRALAELPALAARPGFSALRAVRGGRVYAADGNLYFNRSGPSLFTTIDLLAEMLHPQRFGTGYAGRAYLRVPVGGDAQLLPAMNTTVK
jgi:iron complex transport system substrate-binding protein